MKVGEMWGEAVGASIVFLGRLGLVGSFAWDSGEGFREKRVEGGGSAFGGGVWKWGVRRRREVSGRGKRGR